MSKVREVKIAKAESKSATMTTPDQDKIEPGVEWKDKNKDKNEKNNKKKKDKKDKPKKQMTWNLSDIQCTQEEEQEKE